MYKRADGIVLIDQAKAAGRPELAAACPYGMISWSEESSTPQKCTLCAHLLDAGWTEPRCVQACGPGALSFVWEDDTEFEARIKAEGIETLHPGDLQNTAVCYKNLRRFDTCFVAGSVAVRHGEVIDCAPDVVVKLRKIDEAESGDTAGRAKEEPGAAHPTAAGGTGNTGTDGQEAGVALATVLPQRVVTDAFGDFKFDGLKPDSGEYEVTVEPADGGVVAVRVKLGQSVSLDSVLLEGER